MGGAGTPERHKKESGGKERKKKKRSSSKGDRGIDRTALLSEGRPVSDSGRPVSEQQTGAERKAELAEQREVASGLHESQAKIKVVGLNG